MENVRQVDKNRRQGNGYSSAAPGGGGGTAIYGLYRYVPL